MRRRRSAPPGGSAPRRRDRAHVTGAAMSRPEETRSSRSLQVKFVPDEDVLRHITDDTGTAGPAPPAAPRVLAEGSQQPRRPPGKGIRSTRAGCCRASQKDEASGVAVPRLSPPRSVCPSPALGRLRFELPPAMCTGCQRRRHPGNTRA